jgi:hypothetical protein
VDREPVKTWLFIDSATMLNCNSGREEASACHFSKS